MPDTKVNIFKHFLESLIYIKDKEKNEVIKFINNEEINIFKIIKIKREIFAKELELFEDRNISDENYNNNLIQYFNCIHENIEKVKNILDSYKLYCSKITKYNQLIENFQQLIYKHGINLNHLILMEINYKYQYGGIPNEFDIEKYIKYAQIINECEEDSDEDYTDIFTKIINSKKFKTTAMKSSFIQLFADSKQLNLKYNLFMNNFADKIHEYVLFVPLARGIKAYVSNNMRICFNINSVSISGNANEDLKNEYFTSYLLIHLLNESLNFIYRLEEFGKSGDITKSTSFKNIKEEYSELDLDLIWFRGGKKFSFCQMSNYVIKILKHCFKFIFT